MIWELVLRIGGQLRVVGGFGAARVVGWDMAAALAMGVAMGLPAPLIAEILPEIEAVMVRQFNDAAQEAEG